MKHGILVTVIAIIILAGALVWVKSANKTVIEVVPDQELNITPTQTVASDTTDAALDKDTANVDAKLKAADGDRTNIDAGLNDQQGNLSE